MTTKNWDRIFDTLAHVMTHPDTWNQDLWCGTNGTECGTTYCFAGHAVFGAGLGLTAKEIEEKAGNRPPTDTMHVAHLPATPERKRQLASLGIKIEPESGGCDCPSCGGAAQVFGFADLGQELLGLDDEEREELFDGVNSIHKIVSLLRRWWVDEQAGESAEASFNDKLIRHLIGTIEDIKEY